MKERWGKKGTCGAVPHFCERLGLLMTNHLLWNPRDRLPSTDACPVRLPMWFACGMLPRPLEAAVHIHGKSGATSRGFVKCHAQALRLGYMTCSYTALQCKGYRIARTCLLAGRFDEVRRVVPMNFRQSFEAQVIARCRALNLARFCKL